VNCEEEWGFGGLRPAKEWGFADLGVCPNLPVCRLPSASWDLRGCDAKRRTENWRRPKGIRVTATGTGDSEKRRPKGINNKA
jgi:hypothetical protein